MRALRAAADETAPQQLLFGNAGAAEMVPASGTFATRPRWAAEAWRATRRDSFLARLRSFADARASGLGRRGDMGPERRAASAQDRTWSSKG